MLDETPQAIISEGHKLLSELSDAARSGDSDRMKSAGKCFDDWTLKHQIFLLLRAREAVEREQSNA